MLLEQQASSGENRPPFNRRWMGVLSPLLYPGYKGWDGVLRVICWLDEACILGRGKSKANTSSLRGRSGDRLYCSINSYNMGEGRMARPAFQDPFILGSPHFPESESFPMSQLFWSGGQSIGTSASASVLPMSIQGWFPLGLTGLISLVSKGLLRVLQHHNSKASILWYSAFFMAQLSHPYTTTGKTTALTIRTRLVGGRCNKQGNLCKSFVFSSVQFSRSVMSDSLWPRELQHTRPPCPSPAPGVYPKSCPLSQWCHPSISSSVVPFSSCPQSFPASGSFQTSQLFDQVAKVLELQLQHQLFQWAPRTDLL